MLEIILWTLLYDAVVAASIIFLGNPTSILGELSVKSLASLLLDWQFLLGGVLALVARFIFVIINNIASKQPELASGHLTLTAIITASSIVAVILVNHFLLHEQLSVAQITGAAIIILGIFLVLR